MAGASSCSALVGRDELRYNDEQNAGVDDAGGTGGSIAATGGHAGTTGGTSGNGGNGGGAGNSGSGGAAGNGGAAGTGGSATGSGGTGGTGNTGPLVGPPGALDGWCTGQPTNFSFFVTSMDALWRLAGSTPGDMRGGFGGDLGGVAGADAICQTIAIATGHGNKTWHAFISATDDGNGQPVHAITRVGSGPWYDANGRKVASGISGLDRERPDGDLQSTEDLPDECGVPTTMIGDAHDVITGSDDTGHLAHSNAADTCDDWTSSDPGNGVTPYGRPMCGHSFPRSSNNGRNWMSDHELRGCGKGANLVQDGGGSGTAIGGSGGYGGLYCFAL